MSKPKFNPNLPYEAAKPKFDPSQPFETAEEVSQLESAIRGIAQGGSLGFVDEITGALEAAMSDKAYAQARDESRKAYEEAQASNPITYGAGEIGGAIGTAFIPGLNIAKGATLGARAAGAAGLGATAALGSSQADLTKGEYADAAKDTAIGAALGGALQYGGEKYIAPAFKKAGQWVSDSEFGNNTLKKMGKIAANIPEDHTGRYLDNPEVINKAMSREELAENLLDETGVLTQLKEKIGLADSFAWNELDQNTVISKSALLDGAAETLQKKILDPKGALSRTNGFGSSYDKLSAINGELDKISAAFGDNLSEADLKSIVQDISKKAYSDAGSPKYTHSAEGLRDLAEYFNGSLKGGNKEYEKLMVPVANMTKLSKDLERNFINKQDPGSYDKFLSKLNRWNGADESSSMKSGLKLADKLNGTSLSDDINNTLANESFSKGDTQGSRKTLFGTVVGGGIGTLVGGPVGTVIGGALGAGVGQVGDKYAGVIFKQILNGKIAADKGIQQIAPRMGKFAQPLMDAAKRGNTSLAATHFILQQTQPEYRKMIQDMDKGE